MINMRKKIFLPALALSAALLCGSGCAQEKEGQLIQIPMYDESTGTSFTTAAAHLRDFTQTRSIGGSVEYAFADVLSVGYDTNILSYNVKKGQTLKEGDIIAVFDSSALNYDYQNQKILTENAQAKYQSSGSELCRTQYEEEAKKLEKIQYLIDEYTIKAPYDCVVSGTERFEIGDTVAAGTPVCTVAKPDEAYVVVGESRDSFAVGKKVSLKFGTNETYSATVVMVPESGAGRGVNSSVIIRFDEGEYERATADVGNLVTAGWVTVLVKVYEKYGALAVPEAAVMQYSGSTYCYLDTNGGRARVPVEAGDTLDGYTIILSGLSEGDTVSYR